MILTDALTIPENTLIETEVCIVGAGAAGITIAREFINQPYQVCLLESGGLNYEENTQSLAAGENVGVPYFPIKETRARQLGGSTNLWGGWSRPLDEIDFVYRSWMPYSGWPFAKAELDPYYQRAQNFCGLGAFKYDFSDWEEALNEIQRQQLPFTGEDILTCLWQIIPPSHLRFGQVYKSELEQAKNINTIIHANVLKIETNDTAQTVQRLRVATIDGKQFWVQAKVFILAVGGIENPRLLLNSNEVQSNGLGNQYDLVGRFFMEHPYLVSGKVVLSDAAPLYTQKNLQVNEVFVGTALGISAAAQEREQTLNFATRLLPIPEDWVDAINRLKSKVQHLVGAEPAQSVYHKSFPSLHEGRRDYGEAPVSEDVLKVATNLHHVAARVYAKLFSKKFYSRQSNYCSMHLIGEQAPNPDSRIMLSSERDRLGLHQVKLDWRLSPIDKYTIVRSQELIAEAFERSGAGKYQIELKDDDATWRSVIGSYHHIGTTRMSSNPREGVVNEQCQVYGINNLYVTGSSVFPTSGLSNPTLTIIALAIRLADHIKAQLDTSKLTKVLETTSTK
jgi:hypothetical protein